MSPKFYFMLPQKLTTLKDKMQLLLYHNNITLSFHPPGSTSLNRFSESVDWEKWTNNLTPPTQTVHITYHKHYALQ
jgi:hypothetical protein